MRFLKGNMNHVGMWVKLYQDLRHVCVCLSCLLLGLHLLCTSYHKDRKQGVKECSRLNWPIFALNSTILTPSDLFTEIKNFELKHFWWPLFLLEVQKKITSLLDRIKSPVWPWRGSCANFRSSTTESHMWSVVGRTLLCLGDRYNFYVTHLNLCKLSWLRCLWFWKLACWQSYTIID